MQSSNQYQMLFKVYDEFATLINDNQRQTEQFTQLGKWFEDKRQNPELSIMVYGVYNAGKSSFVNALLGEKVAETDDVPLTDKVTAYGYKDYKILDTPGIDAPIAHQQVADEQLLKSDVILFVVNPSGVAEEQATLDKLLFLVEKQKKVFLIFNEKEELSDVDYFKLKEQTYSILQEMAHKKGLSEILKDIPVYRVNAKRALQGKLENKQTLVEKSHINDIELAINQFIDEIAQNNEVYLSLKSSLLDCIKSYIDDIEKINNDELKQSYDNILKEISACEVGVKNEVKRSIKSATKELRESIESLLFTCEGQDPTQEVEKLVERKAGDVEVEVLHSLANAKERISAYADDFELKVSKAPNQNAKLNYEAELQAQGDYNNLENGDGFASALRLAKGSIERLGQEGVYTALKTLKQIAPELMKNVSNTTLKNLSANIAKHAGAVIAVLLVAWEWWQEKKHQEQVKAQMEEERRAKERQEAQIRDAARKFADDFSMSLENHWLQVIEEVFVPISQGYQELGKMFDEELKKNSLLLAQLSGLQQKLL